MDCNKSHSCLIIGLGQIGMGYDYALDTHYVYTHARAFSMHDGFDLLGAVETDAGKRKLFEYRYKRPSYETVEEALSVEQPDVIIIAVPTSEHFVSIKNILSNSRPKVILCEKPLAYSLEEAEQLLNLCESNSVELYVNYIRRSDP